jgi:hypothetical protein
VAFFTQSHCSSESPRIAHRDAVSHALKCSVSCRPYVVPLDFGPLAKGKFRPAQLFRTGIHKPCRSVNFRGPGPPICQRLSWVRASPMIFLPGGRAIACFRVSPMWEKNKMRRYAPVRTCARGEGISALSVPCLFFSNSLSPPIPSPKLGCRVPRHILSASPAQIAGEAALPARVRVLRSRERGEGEGTSVAQMSEVPHIRRAPAIATNDRNELLF